MSGASVGDARWLLEDHGTDVLRVEEGHEIDDIWVGRERLVLRVQEARPVEDLVVVTLGFVDHLSIHEVVVDGGHAPDRGLDSPTVYRVVSEIFSGEFIGRALSCHVHVLQRHSVRQGHAHRTGCASGNFQVPSRISFRGR
jgi:hypothetical protein